MKGPAGLLVLIGSTMTIGLIRLSFATPPARVISLSPRPGNLVSAHTSTKSGQDLLKIIANGRPRAAMPAWKDHLSADEQHAVLAYILSMVKFARSPTPPPPGP